MLSTGSAWTRGEVEMLRWAGLRVYLYEDSFSGVFESEAVNKVGVGWHG